MPDRRGWSASPVTRIGRRAVILLLALSTFGGLFTSSTPPNAYADELSDAYDKQQALEKLIAKQKASIRSLTASQANLSARISGTKRSLSQLNANLLTVKTQIVGMVVDVARGQNAVDELNATAARLDAELASIEADAAAKEKDLQERMALLASRIVEAYDTDRTTILETFLSGGDFTDVLTEVGYHLEFAEQDKLLADQIAEDRKILDVLKQNVEMARVQTAELRDLAAKSKKALDGQLAELAAARKELAKLEALIARLVREALARGGIPSVYNGTFQWPMQGRITQEFGCTGFSWEPSYGNCNHFHNGIDIANTMYTRVYAAGAGKVIWAGKSPYSTSWNVIIAHSEHLVTWYAHLDNRSRPPVVNVGEYVAKGQLIAFEGMTGYTTGPHLHWAAQLDGNWVNPRLFLPR